MVKSKKQKNKINMQVLFCFFIIICGYLCICRFTIPVKAEATEYTQNNYTYRLLTSAGEEKYAVITVYLGSETNLIIPDSLGGCPVREVKLNSLNTADAMRYEQIQSVVFPDTMVNLSAGACIYFSNLTSVTIPEGTEFIGAGAFAGCFNLTSIAIPASVTNIYGEISNNEALCYQVPNGSYADNYLTKAGKNINRTGTKVPVTDLRIEGEKECSKTLEFTSPSESRTVCLKAELSPAAASNRRIEWKTDRPDIVLFEEGAGLNNNGSNLYFDVKKGGTAKITAASEDGGYTAVCTIHAAVSIVCQEITLSNDTFVYDGKEKRPDVIIDGLTEGIDYTAAYSNNIAPGTGTVTITGTGANTGQVTKNFTITPQKQESVSKPDGGSVQTVPLKKPSGFQVKNIKKNKAKLTWKAVKGADGYEIYRSTRKNGRYKRVKVIQKNSAISFTNSRLKKKKQYFYKIRSYRTAGGAKVYSPFTGVKKVTIKK